MTRDIKDHQQWAHFRFGRNPSHTSDNDTIPPTPMEKRHGYFDFSLSEQQQQQQQQQHNHNEQGSAVPRIFTIEPSLSSMDDDEDDKTQHNDPIANPTDKQPTPASPPQRPPPQQQQRGVSFRPKLEYIGRVYSQAWSINTFDDEPRSRKERLIAFLHRRFPSRIVRRIIKCTIAYFISTLFALINPVADAIGPACVLTAAGVIFNHPGRTMGAQFDTTITSALGICSALAFSYAGLACSVAYNVRHPDTIQYGTIINALFLFLGIFLAQTLRQFLPRFFFFSLQAMTVFIFCFTTTPGLMQTTLPTSLPLSYGIPLLCGAAISQVVNLFVWPETAVDGLGRALQESFSSSRDMLDMITKQFFLDPDSDMVAGEVVDETAEKMRVSMVKVKTAYHEAKYEISYTYIRPYKLGNIQKSLDRLTKHLNILGGSLKTERVLFENAIASLNQQEEEHDMQQQQQQPSELHPTDIDSDQEEVPKKSTLRWLNQEDELNLRRAAMLAAGNTSPQHSRPNSHMGSRAGSRAGSRPGSRAGSRRNSLDEDYNEQNQKSVSSIRSFLNMAKLGGSHAPKPPPKPNRPMGHGDGELLVTYLESLRDPLMRLSMECVSVLDCVSYSICSELDMDDEDDKSIWKTWKSYIRHILRWKAKTETSEGKKKSLPHDPSQCDCSKKMDQAIRRFDKAESERMQRLYDIKGSEDLDLGMREELFLVFFFIFSLREVAKELGSMADTMDELRSSRNGRRPRKHLYMPQLTQKWWRKWASTANHQSVRDRGGYSLAALKPAMTEQVRKTDVQEEYRLTRMKTTDTNSRKMRRMSSVVSQSSNALSPIERLSTKSTLTSLRKRSVTKDSSHSVPSDQLSPTEKTPSKEEDLEEGKEQDTENQQPEEKAPLSLRVRYAIWEGYQFIKKYEFKFALKMGAAVLGLTIPAYVPSSTAWYQSVRGQWTCMTIIAIMNPTSGGTFHASFWRIIGTLIGAFVGWGALESDGGSAYLLALFGVLLSIPFFYLHLASTYNKIGTVVLMTYVAVALSRYVTSPPEPISVTVWKRTITVIIGIVVAVCLNWAVWPFVARHAVRKSIANVIGELGDYYTYLMGTFLFGCHAKPAEEDIKRAQKLEGSIQKSINACNVLLELTDHEPRLKGPFPKDFYKEMIVSTRNLLDRLMSIRIALTNMPLEVKNDICKRELNVYRRDMTAAMLLHFYTLQSSLRSKIPLPAYMPSARSARSRLMRYRHKLSKNGYRWVRYRNICWFAMACCVQEIIEELEHMNDLVRFIVGESKYADRARRLDTLL